MADHTPNDNHNHTPPGESQLPGDDAAPGSPGTGEGICRNCGGSGRIADGGDCPDCGGSGKVTVAIGGA